MTAFSVLVLLYILPERCTGRSSGNQDVSPIPQKDTMMTSASADTTVHDKTIKTEELDDYVEPVRIRAVSASIQKPVVESSKATSSLKMKPLKRLAQKNKCRSSGSQDDTPKRKKCERTTSTSTATTKQEKAIKIEEVDEHVEPVRVRADSTSISKPVLELTKVLQERRKQLEIDGSHNKCIVCSNPDQVESIFQQNTDVLAVLVPFKLVKNETIFNRLLDQFSFPASINNVKHSLDIDDPIIIEIEALPNLNLDKWKLEVSTGNYLKQADCDRSGGAPLRFLVKGTQEWRLKRPTGENITEILKYVKYSDLKNEDCFVKQHPGELMFLRPGTLYEVFTETESVALASSVFYRELVAEHTCASILITESMLYIPGGSSPRYQKKVFQKDAMKTQCDRSERSERRQMKMNVPKDEQPRVQGRDRSRLTSDLADEFYELHFLKILFENLKDDWRSHLNSFKSVLEEKYPKPLRDKCQERSLSVRVHVHTLYAQVKDIANTTDLSLIFKGENYLELYQCAFAATAGLSRYSATKIETYITDSAQSKIPRELKCSIDITQSEFYCILVALHAHLSSALHAQLIHRYNVGRPFTDALIYTMSNSATSQLTMKAPRWIHDKASSSKTEPEGGPKPKKSKMTTDASPSTKGAGTFDQGKQIKEEQEEVETDGIPDNVRPSSSATMEPSLDDIALRAHGQDLNAPAEEFVKVELDPEDVDDGQTTAGGEHQAMKEEQEDDFEKEYSFSDPSDGEESFSDGESNREPVGVIRHPPSSSKGTHDTTKATSTPEKTFSCDVCGNKFAKQKFLARHRRIHTGYTPYECTVCGKKFKWSRSFIYHKRTHTGEKPFHCDECEKTFRCANQLTNHRRIHTGETPYECNVCGKKFHRATHVAKHLRTHSDEKPYECAICNTAYKQKKTLDAHNRKHHGDKTDDVEDSGTGAQQEHKVAKRVSTKSKKRTKRIIVSSDSDDDQRSNVDTAKDDSDDDDQPATEEQCESAERKKTVDDIEKEYSFSDLSASDESPPSEEESAEGNWDPDQDMKSSDELEEDAPEDKKEAPKRVKKTSVLFKDSSDSDESSSSDVESSGSDWEPEDTARPSDDLEQQNVATKGEQKAQKKSNLHKASSSSKGVDDSKKTKTTSKKRKYPCDVCGMRCRTNQALTDHLRVHTGEKPYKCKVCKMGFSQHGTLTYHMRTHTGERPYKCETCGKDFRTSSVLTNHRRIHTGETPYECEVCGKKFNQNSHMKRHLRSHTGEKPHTCAVCKKTFSRKDSLREHSCKKANKMKTKHQE